MDSDETWDLIIKKSEEIITNYSDRYENGYNRTAIQLAHAVLNLRDYIEFGGIIPLFFTRKKR